MIKEMLKYDEGYKTKVYWDTEGYPTVGVGHLIMKLRTKDMGEINRELSAQIGRVVNDGIITDSEASTLFESDLRALQRQIEKQQDLYRVYIKLDSVRKCAIENMCFQLGVAGVAAFKKMIAALDIKDWNEAKKQGLNSKWANQTPNRAKRVTDVIVLGNYNPYGF